MPFTLSDPEPPPETLDLEQATAVRKGSPEALRPTLEETFAKSSIFEMPPTETRRIVDVHPDRIVPGPWGTPDGIADVGADPGAIIGVAFLDHVPATRVRVPPAYPPEARQRGLSGEVLVEFVVSEAGRVLHPHIVRASDPLFEAATLRAVEKWRFEPGRKNGKLVRYRMAVPVVFNLED
jgi:protein TonB